MSPVPDTTPEPARPLATPALPRDSLGRMTLSSPANQDRPTWQERALTRSLGSARARSVELAGRLVEAARALAAETGSTGFTVQQVVERAGVSLKSFYRYFGSKDELLLALFEEEAQTGAGLLAAHVDRQHEPLARLEACVAGLFSLLAGSGQAAYAAMMVREHVRLTDDHPDELRAVHAPFLHLVRAEVAEAMARGVVPAGDPDRAAVTIFYLVVAHLHALLLGYLDGDPGDIGRYLWDFCRGALGVKG